MRSSLFLATLHDGGGRGAVGSGQLGQPRLEMEVRKNGNYGVKKRLDPFSFNAGVGRVFPVVFKWS